jgi:hypothetical protein
MIRVRIRLKAIPNDLLLSLGGMIAVIHLSRLKR